MKHFLRHIELFLSAAGLLVIFLVPMLHFTDSQNYWQVVALTAIGVGILHGFIFWMVRRRQQAVREQAITEITMMLQDRINNALSTIMMQTQFSHEEVAQRNAQLQSIQRAVENISRQLQDVSDESLASWKDKYSQAHASLHSR